MDANLILYTVLGYVIGSFPTGVVLSRKKYGIDVREMGSGNIGATNITRTFGWYAGAVTLLVDCVKGWLPVWFVSHFHPEDPRLVASVGLAVVAGHCFSVFLKGRGGKGVATSLGVLLGACPLIALVAAVTYAVALAMTRISAVGSLAGLAAAGLSLIFFKPPREILMLVGGISGLVVVRHHSNIRRLLAGTETRKGKS